VQPHAHFDRAARESTLTVCGRSDRIGSPTERDEEGITLCVHLDAVVVCEGVSKETPMFMQRVRIGVAELMEELRRPFDVREEEGHDTGRECAHHPRMIPP
jgi:hypothetical protein